MVKDLNGRYVSGRNISVRMIVKVEHEDKQVQEDGIEDVIAELKNNIISMHVRINLRNRLTGSRYRAFIPLLPG